MSSSRFLGNLVAQGRSFVYYKVKTRVIIWVYEISECLKLIILILSPLFLMQQNVVMVFGSSEMIFGI